MGIAKSILSILAAGVVAFAGCQQEEEPFNAGVGQGGGGSGGTSNPAAGGSDGGSGGCTSAACSTGGALPGDGGAASVSGQGGEGGWTNCDPDGPGGSEGCCYQDEMYRTGEAVPAFGCECTCSGLGYLECDDQCDGCSAAFTVIFEALDAAKICDPQIDSPQCTAVQRLPLECCPFFVNGAHLNALDVLPLANAVAHAYSCDAYIECPPCPVSAHCGDEGKCVDDFL